MVASPLWTHGGGNSWQVALIPAAAGLVCTMLLAAWGLGLWWGTLWCVPAGQPKLCGGCRGDILMLLWLIIFSQTKVSVPESVLLRFVAPPGALAA